jgi:uncharacterized protein (TIGR03437 family)
LRIDVDRTTMKIEAVDLAGVVRDSWEISSGPVVFEPLLNAANYSGAYAVGGLVSLFGWNLSAGELRAAGPALPMELSGTALRAAGKDVALLYASPMQVNALMPYEAIGAMKMTVKTGVGEVSFAIDPKAVAPALFTRSSGGREIAAALHMDGSLVDELRPAVVGEWIVVFGTGLGKMREAPGYGQSALVSPLATAEGVVSATADGKNAEIYFAGLAPGFFGLNQVNLKVPAVSGPTQLRVFVNGIGSSAIELPVK